MLPALCGVACRSVNRYEDYEPANPIEAHDKVCGDCHKLYPATFFAVSDWRTFLDKHPEAHRPQPAVMESILEYILQDAPTESEQAEASL